MKRVQTAQTRQTRASGWHEYGKGKTRHERGYGKAYQRVRRLVIERDQGLCQQCKRMGKLTPGAEVDHIKPLAHGGDHSSDNLEYLCRACHAFKTAREHSGRALPGCDIDGLPTDSAHHWHQTRD